MRFAVVCAALGTLLLLVVALSLPVRAADPFPPLKPTIAPVATATKGPLPPDATPQVQPPSGPTPTKGPLPPDATPIVRPTVPAPASRIVRQPPVPIGTR